MDVEDRIKAASKFLIQSPPGEINDVLNGAVNASHLLISKFLLIRSNFKIFVTLYPMTISSRKAYIPL